MIADFDNLPVDLDLWRGVKSAPKSERWKWDWATWDPVIHQILFDLVTVRSIEGGKIMWKGLFCPVCGSQEVYAFFLTVEINVKRSERVTQIIYVGDRYFGCDNCRTQVRDRGLLPHSLKGPEILWATKWDRKRAMERASNLKINNSEDQEQ